MGSPEEHELVFRCVAFPGSNDGNRGYYAECIDANILVWRPTQHEAVHQMNEALYGFLEAAAKASESHDEFHELIDRPSPLGNKARYHGIALLLAIPGIWRRVLRRASIYSVPTPEPALAQSL